MGEINGSTTKLLIDGFDMSAYFPGFDMEASQAINDHTTLGATADSSVPGLKTGTGSGECFLDDTANVGSFAVLKARYGATPGTGIPAAVTKSIGALGVGNPVAMGYFDNPTLSFKSIVADLQKMTFEGAPSANAIDFGK